jgi:hypothetical protein
VSARRDPDRLVEEWRDVSRHAAVGTAYRARPRAVARSSAVRSVGALAVVVLVVVGGLAIRSAAPTTSPGGPVVGTAEDANFRLVLTTPRTTYTTSDAIEPVASVTYLGPKASETMFHAMYPIGFRIEEVGGVRNMGGGMDQPCISTELAKGSSDVLPFGKAGSPDDPKAGFDIAWYQDPVLRLPLGTWRIIAYLDIQLGKCGGEPHQLTVENVVRVVAGANPTATATSTQPTIPSASLSEDAATALEIVRKYEDGLTTGHFENVWDLLSPWSKTTVGSFTTFADAESRELAVLGDKIEIGDPSRDPSLLDPAFLGERAKDLVATADPSRTWVVSIRRPSVDGAAATTNLVVARTLGGDWRIWLDTVAGSYGGWSFPSGCSAFGLSGRRCEAVVKAAASNLGFDRSTAVETVLMPEPGCGGDPLSTATGSCVRTQSFIAGVRFDTAGGTSLRTDVFCGVVSPPLICSETPGIEAVDLHRAGYWDIPCGGEAPGACPTRIPTPTGAAAAAGRELKVDAIAVPVGAVGHREVEIGRAILVDGIVQEARFSIADQTQAGFLLDPGLVRMELRSTVPGRPPFDNVYQRGTFQGPEEVRVILIFDVAETGPGAVIHVTDVLVR